MKFTSALKLKLIYVFRINDEAHKGCLKVGEATSDNENIWGLEPNSKSLNKAAKHRIDQYTQTAGITYDLLYTEVSVYAEKGILKAFSDSEVHNVLLRSGIKRKTFDTKNKANEWFITDLETVKKAINAVKDGKDSLHVSEVTKTQSPIIFRREQKEAIENTAKQFKRGNEMLWFAKMRFGKTLSALQVVKNHSFTRTLILTHRPVVDKGWFEDFGKIFYDSPAFSYGSKNKGNQFSVLERNCKNGISKYIYFASMQDLRGSELVGGSFDKNDEIFSTEWDFIIIDEAHEGTQTELGKNVLAELKTEVTKILYLSGTPFNLLDNYEEDEIFTWDYVMEQKAKVEWDKIHFGDPNPYASLPKLNIFTYDLGKLLHGYIDEEVAFNFREFFRVNESGDLLHKTDVNSFLNLICKSDKESKYPYSTKEYRDNFRHSLWMVPGVKEARALSLLLQSHPVFGHFKIVNVAGDGDEEEAKNEALRKVESAIGDKPHETYTITLSCGRLTTGVSVKAWTAVFMLSGSHNTSASSYMQTIFRVQTPATINGKVKEECFVFDFAPDRTLKVIAETAKVSAKAGKTSETDRNVMGEFLNFCPIIAFDGSRMKEYDVNGMLDQLKKVYVERVVNNGFEDGHLYNRDQLMQLSELEVKEFNGLKKVIGSTKAIPKSKDIEVNKQGFTEKDYEKIEQAQKRKNRELSGEERELLERYKKQKKMRDTAISILRGISIRMPLLIYGADVSNEEKELTLDNFTDLVDDQSWEEFMPKGVDKNTFQKFKKYYERDVFRASGKRIRELARAADQQTIEERIERITHIFGTFRNPDKETVLTPWRVVNMHMSDCLGGYSFLDDKREKTISQPHFVSQGKATREAFAIDSVILEINSKSGLYPLYVTYTIFRNRIEKKYPNKEHNTLSIAQQQELWDLTIAENVFVLCKTPMAKSITKRTLVGFRDAHVNTHFFENMVHQITQRPEKFISKIKKGESYWKVNKNNNMKFNAIVGNPPYQEMDGGAGSSAKPIYNHFVTISKNINPNYITLITPSRWFAGGKGLDEFRNSMLSDHHFRKMVDFVNSKDCFPSSSIGGGVNYFLWDSEYEGHCEFVNIHNGVSDRMERKLDEFETLIRYNQAVVTIHKVRSLKEKKLSKIISSRNPFGLPTNVRGKDKPFDDSIKLLSSDGEGYISKSLVGEGKAYVKQYKVIVSRITSEHAGEPASDGRFKILSRTEILGPNEVCTDSYLSVGKFENEAEAEAALKYIRSKFTRFLILQSLSSINLSRDKFDFVPIQDFTENSSIKWSKSIQDIDEQLYEKYKLSGEEIEFIERMIKPMQEIN